MRTLIIDGYNVIHALPEVEDLLGESLQAARVGLFRLLAEFKDSRKDVRRIFVVFDGKSDGFDEEAAVSPGITAVYTNTDKDADDKILEIIKSSSLPGEITVVSNDNFLYNNSRSLGARIKSVKEFCQLFK